jgi:hypothetical protein
MHPWHREGRKKRFFEKKRAKNSGPLRVALAPPTPREAYQKFFASFFQKRSAFFDY